MELFRGLKLLIIENLSNAELFDLAAVCIFSVTLLFLVLRLRQRIRIGQKYLDDLPEKTGDIAEAITNAARLATLAEPSGEERNALVVSGSSRQVKGVLQPEGSADAAKLRQPLAELESGLLNFADNLTVSTSLDTRRQRFVAFQRVSESFSAQLPDRFVAAPRAMAFSRLSVQSGLAFSVLFILFALAGNDAEAVLRNVTFKFGFTLFGLAASLIVQIMLGSAVRKANLAFLKFEEDLNRKLGVTVTSPLAASYRLLQDQRMLKEELKHTLEAFSEQIGKLDKSAVSLGSAAGQAAGTLTDIMTATREASAEVAEQVATHVKAMANAMEDAQIDYRTKLDGHASAVIARYGGALRTASEVFKADVRKAGADFDGTVSASGKGFFSNVNSAADKIGASSERFAAEASKAGVEFRSSVFGAGGSFSTNVDSASEKFSSAVDASAQTLSTSCAGATESFEKQFEAASKRYLESVGKIGETTAEIANIQASLVQRVADEEARARARIGELTSEAVERLNQIISEKKAIILEERRKERSEHYKIDYAEISDADPEGSDLSEEAEPADVPVETPIKGSHETEPDTPHDPPKRSEDKGGLEG